MEIVDLRSDTVTKPCLNMRKAMAEAEVGDDVLGDDPTIIKLEEAISGLLGKEDAIFVPSGTMANQLAIWLHTQRGDAIALHKDAHIRLYEAGAPAVISSVMMRTLDGEDGLIDLDSLGAAFPATNPHFAPTTMVCVEDTANKGGGTVYPLDRLDQLAECAQKNSASTHIDGARFFNAQAESGCSVQRRAKNYDTVSICFSKGLGAPVGSALCIPKEWRTRAIRARKIMGGGMRQSGILAAAALYALENNVEKLTQDHQHARELADTLRELGFTVRSNTNMVYFDAKDPDQLIQKLQESGIWALALDSKTIRMVTHLQVTPKGIQRTCEALKQHSTAHLLS
jgi:threonine aldolase